MKSIKTNLFTLLALLCLLGTGSLFAQQESNNKDKNKIVIIQKTLDDNGNETIEKRVIESDDVATSIYSMDWDDDGNSKKIERTIEIIRDEDDFDLEDGNRKIKIKILGDNGEMEEIEWEGSGELPAEFKAKLKEHKLNFSEMRDGDHHHCTVRTNKSCHKNNGAFLGVVMGKTIEVTNEDGIENEVIEGVNENGVIIKSIVDGSAAEDAGLLADDILNAIDGNDIEDISDLTDVLDSKNIGDVVNIVYIRNGAPAEMNVTLGSQNSNSFNWTEDHDHNHNYNHNYNRNYNYNYNSDYNFEVDPCAVFIGVYLNTNEKIESGGIVVRSVIEDTPASEAGIQAGDVITQIDGVAVNSFASLVAERNKHNSGDEFTITYTRNGQTLDVLATFKSCDQENLNEEERSEEELKDAMEEHVNVSPQGQSFDMPRLELEEINVFPNPTSGTFRLHFEAAAIPTVITILDITGKEIYREDLKDFDGVYNEQITLNNEAAAGTLLMTLRQNDKVFTEKLMYTNGKL